MCSGGFAIRLQRVLAFIMRLFRIKDPDIQCIGIANPDEPCIKGNASFERPELPNLGVGKWPMCTHSAHLAPLFYMSGR